MLEAWKYNRECKLLRDTLQSFSWNGRALSHSFPPNAEKQLSVERIGFLWGLNLGCFAMKRGWRMSGILIEGD